VRGQRLELVIYLFVKSIGLDEESKELTLLGAVWKSSPVILEISAATFTSKPFRVLRPCIAIIFIYYRHSKPTSYTHGSNRSASLCKAAQAGENILDPFDAVCNLLDITAKLLSESERRRILFCCKRRVESMCRIRSDLQVSTTDFDYVAECLGFGFKGPAELYKSRK